MKSVVLSSADLADGALGGAGAGGRGVEHDVGILLQEGDAQEPAEVGGGEAVVVVEAHLFSGTPSGGFKASPGHTMSFISTCS